MPVVFDQVVGTVTPPPATGDPSTAAPPAQPPIVMQQMIVQMWRDREKRLARIRAN
jgi:hypothetical protein